MAQATLHLGLRPHRYRQALLGWMMTGNADAAVAFALQPMTLREACDQAKAAAVLLEAIA